MQRAGVAAYGATSSSGLSPRAPSAADPSRAGGLLGGYAPAQYAQTTYSQMMPAGTPPFLRQRLAAGGLDGHYSQLRYSHDNYKRVVPDKAPPPVAAAAQHARSSEHPARISVRPGGRMGDYARLVSGALNDSTYALGGTRAPPRADTDLTKRRAPTLRSVDHLRPLVPERLQDAYFAETPGPTDWERRAQGGVELGVAGSMPTVDELAAYFNVHVLPASIAPETRMDYGGMWRAWVTFCYAQGCLLSAFPADNHTLRAFLVHLLLCRYAPATVAKYLSAVTYRCRQFGAPSPLAFREMAAWLRPLRRLVSAPAALRSRLWPHHLQSFLSMPSTDEIHERNVLMIAVGTVGAMRPSELVALDVCDWLAAFEDAGGGPLGDAAYIKRQKNDQSGLGMFKRFAYGSAPHLCIPSRMKQYMWRMGLQRSPQCAKWSGDVGARSRPCQFCGRLFRKMVRCGTRAVVKTAIPHDLGRDTVQSALLGLLTLTGALAAGFTGKAMRRGGLSTAKRAGIPPALRREQSGHRSLAHTRYESSSEDDAEGEGGSLDLPVDRPQGGWQVQHLYRFSQAFGL